LQDKQSQTVPVALSPALRQQQSGLTDQPLETTPTSLQKNIPRELMQKLEVARKGGSMVGERRVVTV